MIPFSPGGTRDVRITDHKTEPDFLSLRDGMTRPLGLPHERTAT